MNLKGLSLTMNLTSRSTVPPLVQQYPVEWCNPRGNSGNLEFGRLVLGGATKNVLKSEMEMFLYDSSFVLFGCGCTSLKGHATMAILLDLQINLHVELCWMIQWHRLLKEIMISWTWSPRNMWKKTFKLKTDELFSQDLHSLGNLMQFVWQIHQDQNTFSNRWRMVGGPSKSCPKFKRHAHI